MSLIQDENQWIDERGRDRESGLSLDTLDSLVRSFLSTRRIDDAWHLFFLDDAGQLISTHVYDQDRAERLADKWRETYKNDQSFRVVVVGPNAEAETSERSE